MKKKKLNKIQNNLRQDYIMRHLIDQTELTKPYVDTSTCTVYWGTDSEVRKEKRRQ